MENAIPGRNELMSSLRSPIGKVFFVTDSVSQIIVVARLSPELVSLISRTKYSWVMGLVILNLALASSSGGTTKLIRITTSAVIMHDVIITFVAGRW